MESQKYKILYESKDKTSESIEVGSDLESKIEVKSEDKISLKDDYVIQLRNVHKTYLIGVEGVPALRGVSLKVKRGEFLIILGTSGGGKTTLLNIIGTIDTPSRGDVKIFDTLIRSNTPDEVLSNIRSDRVAFIFQSFNLLPSLTVLENVEIPMKIKGDLSSTGITERAKELLVKVGLGERLNHYPNQLSGGEQQRVTIARALSNKPDILLLDEPTGDLDTKNSDIVMKILLDLNILNNITMIMVTHDVGLKAFGDRVVRVVDGKINNEYLIDINKKQDAIDKLNERINSNINQLREGATVTHSDTTRTFTRKVSDYKIKKCK
jgi:putative ABC transport system ATP-binding protein